MQLYGHVLSSDNGGVDFTCVSATASDAVLRFHAAIVSIRLTQGGRPQCEFVCIIGGQDARPGSATYGLATNNVSCSYDGAAWWEAPKLPLTIVAATASMLDGQVLLVGGLRGDGSVGSLTGAVDGASCRITSWRLNPSDSLQFANATINTILLHTNALSGSVLDGSVNPAIGRSEAVFGRPGLVPSLDDHVSPDSYAAIPLLQVQNNGRTITMLYRTPGSLDWGSVTADLPTRYLIGSRFAAFAVTGNVSGSTVGSPDLTSQRVLLLAAGKRIFRSVDDGSSWNASLHGFISGGVEWATDENGPMTMVNYVGIDKRNNEFALVAVDMWTVAMVNGFVRWQDFIPCKPGHWMQGECRFSPFTCRCTACSSCSGDTFELIPCSVDRDAMCETCTICESNGTVAVANCNATHDSVCIQPDDPSVLPTAVDIVFDTAIVSGLGCITLLLAIVQSALSHAATSSTTTWGSRWRMAAASSLGYASLFACVLLDALLLSSTCSIPTYLYSAAVVALFLVCGCSMWHAVIGCLRMESRTSNGPAAVSRDIRCYYPDDMYLCVFISSLHAIPASINDGVLGLAHDGITVCAVSIADTITAIKGDASKAAAAAAVPAVSSKLTAELASSPTSAVSSGDPRRSNHAAGSSSSVVNPLVKASSTTTASAPNATVAERPTSLNSARAASLHHHHTSASPGSAAPSALEWSALRRRRLCCGALTLPSLTPPKSPWLAYLPALLLVDCYHAALAAAAIKSSVSSCQPEVIWVGAASICCAFASTMVFSVLVLLRAMRRTPSFSLTAKPPSLVSVINHPSTTVIATGSVPKQIGAVEVDADDVRMVDDGGCDDNDSNATSSLASVDSGAAASLHRHMRSAELQSARRQAMAVEHMAAPNAGGPMAASDRLRWQSVLGTSPHSPNPAFQHHLSSSSMHGLLASQQQQAALAGETMVIVPASALAGVQQQQQQQLAFHHAQWQQQHAAPLPPPSSLMNATTPRAVLLGAGSGAAAEGVHVTAFGLPNPHHAGSTAHGHAGSGTNNASSNGNIVGGGHVLATLSRLVHSNRAAVIIAHGADSDSEQHQQRAMAAAEARYLADDDSSMGNYRAAFSSRARGTGDDASEAAAVSLDAGRRRVQRSQLQAHGFSQAGGDDHDDPAARSDSAR